MTRHNVDDLRIVNIQEVVPPSHVLRDFPCNDAAGDTVFEARRAIHAILDGSDDRLLVVVGPCSVHDPASARDYARLLMAERERLKDRLEIVMRVYFEKPRTTVGWKGLINDPDLNDSFNINKGLKIARELLLDINEMGMPAGTEFLDVMTPQYVADLVAWGAIGARTTESQVHRELASGLSCPVGFKNGTDGNLRIACDAIKSASQPHHFLSVTKAGHSAIVSTAGNPDCHIILRGGKEPNYDAKHVEDACQQAAEAKVDCRLMIDASHGNSRKDPANQPLVIDEVAGQVAAGERRIMGVMIESNLVHGRQDLAPGKSLTYGQSITDGCIGWDQTGPMFDRLAEAVELRRKTHGGTSSQAA